VMAGIVTIVRVSLDVASDQKVTFIAELGGKVPVAISSKAILCSNAVIRHTLMKGNINLASLLALRGSFIFSMHQTPNFASISCICISPQ
jgi:hypothetical protein